MSSDTSTQRDEVFMRMAIAEARAAELDGEVPVGAVIVASTGEVIGRGRNRVIADCDPTAHCEIVAMRKAGRVLNNYRLLDATLYCTLEPCAMCAGAMVHARVARLVFAARDPKAGACGSALEVLRHSAMNHRMEVSDGVLAEEAGTMLSNFFRSRRNASVAFAASEPVTEAVSHGNGASAAGGIINFKKDKIRGEEICGEGQESCS